MIREKKIQLAFLKVARTLEFKVRNNPGRTICSQVEETFKVIRRAIVFSQFQDVAIAEQVAISGVPYQTYAVRGQIHVLRNEKSAVLV